MIAINSGLVLIGTMGAGLARDSVTLSGRLTHTKELT